MNSKLNKAGFTLVELLLAMAFFSFILLFITTGFLLVSRAYNKGITVKITQDEGRRFIEQLTREMRTASSISTATDCVSLGDNIYQWSIHVVPTDPLTPTWLVKETNKTCGDKASDITDPGVERVLNDRIGVQFLEVKQLSGGQFYTIHMVLSTTEKDLIDNPGQNAQCSTDTGSQYCDIVEFSTIVSRR